VTKWRLGTQFDRTRAAMDVEIGRLGDDALGTALTAQGMAMAALGEGLV
jgi:hypothetical protein